MPQSGKVRIIGGQWRSRLISVANEVGVRPTPNRVRETVFNWLGQDLQGKHCIDLFAGSGAMGFESASRGAESVVMVEIRNNVFQVLRSMKEKLGATQIKLVKMDAIEFIRSDQNQYDVIYLDPPFQLDLLPKILPLLPSRLSKSGIVYLESEYPFQQNDRWVIWKCGRAGNVFFQLLKCEGHEQSNLPGYI